MTWTAEEATQELLRILPLLNRIVGSEVRQVAGEETTIGQFRVLVQLDEAPLTMSTLAKRRRVSLQAMSSLVQSLVERGWIERLPDPHDRRQQLLRLTASGQAHYENAQSHILDHLLPLVADLSPDEMRAVEQALTALRRVLMQEEGEAAE